MQRVLVSSPMYIAPVGMQGGQVLEQGTHDELMQRHNGAYAQLVNHRQREPEKAPVTADDDIVLAPEPDEETFAGKAAARRSMAMRMSMAPGREGPSFCTALSSDVKHIVISMLWLQAQRSPASVILLILYRRCSAICKFSSRSSCQTGGCTASGCASILSVAPDHQHRSEAVSRSERLPNERLACFPGALTWQNITQPCLRLDVLIL